MRAAVRAAVNMTAFWAKHDWPSAKFSQLFCVRCENLRSRDQHLEQTRYGVGDRLDMTAEVDISGNSLNELGDSDQICA